MKNKFYEKKKAIVIRNYFNKDCNVDDSIKEAYRKGFERALEITSRKKEKVIKMTDFEITKMFWKMMQKQEKDGVITLEIDENTDWEGKMIKVFSTDIYLPEGETHWFLFEFNKSGKMISWEE